MTITIKLNLNNATFQDYGKEYEVTRILACWLADYNLCERGTVTLFDVNGNRVGTVTTTGRT